MKIEKEFRDDHQVKLTVVIDPDPFERAKRIAARKIAKSVKIPGFRPGKAPYGVILRTVGESAVVEGAIDILVKEEYPKIIEEAEIEPYGSGTLENVPELDPPTFEFVIPLEAEVELGDYKTISFPYEVPAVTEAEVNESIKQVQEQNAVRESVERPAGEGDVVFMRVSAINLDIEDEEEAVIVKERFSSSKIEAKVKDFEWPYPGFSKTLIGLSAGDEKTIQYQYPEDFDDEVLKGVNAEYHVVVTNIQSQTLPEIDDELAKTAGDFDTLDEWKTNLKETLGLQALKEYNQEYDDQVSDQVVEMSSIKFPPQMLELEKKEMMRGLEHNLSRQGLSKELYLQIRGLDEDGLDEELTPMAETRIKRSLVLIDIARAENIEANPETVKQELGRTFEAISRSMSPKEAKKLAKSDYIPALATNIVTDLLTQKTMDYLRATAKGEPWPVEEDQPEDESGEASTEEATQSGDETVSPETEVESQLVGESTPEETEAAPENESQPKDEETTPETG